MRVYNLTFRSKAGAIALGIAALAVGGVFLFFGLALLIVVGVIGLALGAGIILYHKLTGRGLISKGMATKSYGLDPSNEVFPADPPATHTLGRPAQHDTAQPTDRGGS